MGTFYNKDLLYPSCITCFMLLIVLLIVAYYVLLLIKLSILYNKHVLFYCFYEWTMYHMFANE